MISEDQLFDLVKSVPVTPLGTADRRRLAAEIMARADAADLEAARGRGRNVAAIASVVALAAAAMLVLLRHVDAVPAVEAPDVVAETRVDEPTLHFAPSASPVDPPPSAPTLVPVPITSVKDAGSAAPPAPSLADAVTAFREGYKAMRDRRYEDALLAFSRATDPAVVEDAAFWTAITYERMGNRAEAEQRMARFILDFPSSPRIDDARQAIARLTH